MCNRWNFVDNVIYDLPDMLHCMPLGDCISYVINNV